MLTYSISGSDASDFTIDADSGKVTFKKLPDYESAKKQYKFRATVKDPSDSSDTQDVTINIRNINDNTPIFTNDNNAIVDEEQTDAIKLLAIDIDNRVSVIDTLTFSISKDDASDFTLDSATGVVTFNTAPDYESNKTSYSFEAMVTDGTFSSTQNVTINIKNLDDNLPVFQNLPNIKVDENTSDEAITLVANDDDGGTLTYSMDGTDVSSLTIDSVSGKVTFKDIPDYETKKSYTFRAIVKDSADHNDTQDVTITIENINDNAPTFTGSNSASVDEEQTDAIHYLLRMMMVRLMF
jgi:hypothetical protein